MSKNDKLKKNERKRNYIGDARKHAIIFGIISYICVGVIYAWSNFVDPMEESGFSRTETSTAFTISMIAFGVCCLLGGWMTKRYGSSITIRLGAFLMLVGMWSTSKVTDASLLYVTYGVITSMGYGITYTTIMSAVQSWFPDKVGFVSGLLLTGYGMGGTIWGTIAVKLISEYSWRTSFAVIGISIGVILLLASRFMVEVDTDDELKLQAYLAERASDKAGSNTDPAEPKLTGKVNKSANLNQDQAIEVDLKGMLKRKSFWMYFAWACLISALWSGTVSKAAVFALDIGATVSIATITAGLITCGNGLGRLICGYMHDHFARKHVMLVISLVLLAATLLFYVALTGMVPWLLMIASLVMGLGYGAQASTNPVFIRRFYGETNYAENFGIVNFNSIFGAVFGSTMGNYLAVQFNGYNVMMLYFIAIAVLAILSQMMIKRP